MTIAVFAVLLAFSLVLLIAPFVYSRTSRRDEPVTAIDRGLLAIMTGGIVAGSILIYVFLGSPELEDRPFIGNDVTAATAADPELATVIVRARSAVDADPTNVRNWVFLADAYGLGRRFRDAALALSEAVILDDTNATLLARLGEYLTLSRDGQVTPAAQSAFDRALALDPDQGIARYYTGVAHAQRGAFEEALSVWRDLLAQTPPDAPWYEQLRRHIADAEIMLADTLSSGMSTVDAIDPEAENSDAMIRGMVEQLAARLENEPDNAEGWARLALSWNVLEEWNLSRQAHLRALVLAPDDPDLWDGLAKAVAGIVSMAGEISAQSLDDMEQVLVARPENAAALFITGLAAARTGAMETARDRWTALRDLYPVNSMERSRVELLLESLQ